ncbi:MAG TPA: hypothetical protein VGJ77_17920 [Gaiellaceae bacterium]|jgi:hypothetical protein
MDVTRATRERSTGRPLAWAGALFAYVVFCFRLPGGDKGGAEGAGYVFGGYLFTLLLGLAVWAIIHFTARRKQGLPFASPWIFAIAAGFGLLSLLGNMSSGG